MKALLQRRVLLGVTGSIAAYKTPILVRRLVEAGAQVQVVVTASAKRFVAPTSLAAVSGRPVRDDLWDETAEQAMSHLELARWADVILIAPASADILARLTAGRADDLLSTLCLASPAELVVAPAMNHRMWAHSATRDNMATLTARGVSCIGPEVGELAEHESGAGRMTEPEAIRDALIARDQTRSAGGVLSGRRVVVTAGPTREALDPVRYLTNRSSGRMGYALAAASVAAGAEVTLVSGPTALDSPAGVARVDVESAGEMYTAVMETVDGADIFIGAAAVADYRPAESATDKIKKTDGENQLRLVRTRDIIAEVAARQPAVFALGFAAETKNMEAAARDKLARKGLSMIAGNVVGPDRAFGREDNELWVFWPDGERRLGKASKTELARALVTLIGERLAQ